MEIVLEPVINYGVEALFAVVAVLLSWALKQGADWLGVQRDSVMFGWIEGQVDRVLAQAEKRVKSGQLAQASLNTDSELVAELAQTVVDKAPRYLKRLGLDEADVREMVLERL